MTGNELRLIRTKKLHYTQNELADELGVSKITVCRWETDRVSIPKTIENLVTAILTIREKSL